MDIVIPIGIYCYFGLIRIEKLRSFLLINTKRNKRYFNMSETYPRKNRCETLFAEHISLQRRNRLQRYYKICTYANKIAQTSDFCLVSGTKYLLFRVFREKENCHLCSKTQMAKLY